MFSKKLKKLVLNPRGFFYDSWFFNARNKTIDVLSTKCFNGKNIFIISNLSQLKKVEEFIKKFNKRKNSLVILATKKNLRMPNMIIEQMDGKLFSSTNLLVIPTSPNTFSWKKILWFHHVYNHIVISSNARHAYFMSYEYHYSIFLALFRKHNVRCHLIEEGMGTYKKIYRSIVLDFDLYCAFFDSLKYFRYPSLHFEKVYGSFPDLLKDKFRAKQFVEFTNVPSTRLLPELASVISKYGFSCDDIIYVNQKYAINQELFAKNLVFTLIRLQKSKMTRVFIKFHPKEPVENIDVISKVINESKCKDVILISEPDFLIEPIIKKFKIKTLIGLTSSSLVYSSLISNKCQAYSIAPLILELCNNEQSKKGIVTLAQHFEILKNFDNVRIISDFSDPIFSAQ